MRANSLKRLGYTTPWELTEFRQLIGDLTTKTKFNFGFYSRLSASDCFLPFLTIDTTSPVSIQNSGWQMNDRVQGD